MNEQAARANSGADVAQSIQCACVSGSGGGANDAGDLVAPVLWSDNYIELLPGESRTLTAVLPSAPSRVEVRLSGWNIPEQTLHVGTGGKEVADAKVSNAH